MQGGCAAPSRERAMDCTTWQQWPGEARAVGITKTATGTPATRKAARAPGHKSVQGNLASHTCRHTSLGVPLQRHSSLDLGAEALYRYPRHSCVAWPRTAAECQWRCPRATPDLQRHCEAVCHLAQLLGYLGNSQAQEMVSTGMACNCKLSTLYTLNSHEHCLRGFG